MTFSDINDTGLIGQSSNFDVYLEKILKIVDRF